LSGLGNMISNVFVRSFDIPTCSLLTDQLGIPTPPQNLSSSSPPRSPTPSALELGRPKKSRKARKKSSSQSHSYHELSHVSRHSNVLSEVSTDSDEARDVEKQRLGIIPVRKTEREKELASMEIPYQVPSDDTSGYVETKEELMQDQKDRIETEQYASSLLLHHFSSKSDQVLVTIRSFWTPFVIIEWYAIVLIPIFFRREN